MDPEVTAVVQHLWCYLQNHPDACDTPEGIARWWVHGDTAVTLDTVAAALAWMASHRLVEALHAADGRTLYRGIRGAADLDALLAAAPAQGAKRPPQKLH